MACSKDEKDVSKLLVECIEDKDTKQAKLSLTNDGKNCIETIPDEYKIVPVAVVGQGRLGKSSLMNRLIGKYVFTTGSTTARVTKGIWVYVDLKSDTKTAFVYIDVEGFGDAEKTSVDEYDRKLLAIVYQVSSLIMYNTRDVYEKDMIEKLILIHTISGKYRKLNDVFTKPIFALVFRDFFLDFPENPDQELQQQLERHTLKPCQGGDDFSPFEKVKSFPLVTPTRRRVNNLHELPDEELDEDFVTWYNSLKALIEQEAKALRVKDSNYITRRVFREVVEKTVNIVNTDKTLHGISPTVFETLKQQNGKILEDAIISYEKELRQKWPILEDEEESIQVVANRCMENAYKEVQRSCFTVPGKVEFEFEKLKDELQKTYKRLLREKCEDAAEKALEDLLAKLKKDIYDDENGHEDYKKDLKSAEQKYAHFKNLGPDKKTVWEEKAKELSKEETWVKKLTAARIEKKEMYAKMQKCEEDNSKYEKRRLELLQSQTYASVIDSAVRAARNIHGIYADYRGYSVTSC